MIIQNRGCILSASSKKKTAIGQLPKNLNLPD